MTTTNSSINHKSKSHFNLLWGGGAKLPPYFTGYKFIVSDYSATEARVLAHLAGKAWRSKVFAEGKDIYCASASQMFGVPVEKHGVNSHLRQNGKIAELALGYGGS